MTEMPPLEPPPKGATQSSLRKWAWRAGCRAAFSDGYDIGYFLAHVEGMEDNIRDELRSMFETALRRGRDPSGPEKAATVVKEYESLYGQVKTQTKLGRSKAYPRLLLMAYALGRDGRPFAFAEHRIAQSLGVDAVTVLAFRRIVCRLGYLSIIREGVSGFNGQSAWYRLDVAAIKTELGLDVLFSTFERHIARIMA